MSTHLIGARKVPTTTEGGGIWGIREQYNFRKDGIWPMNDPYFANVSLLMHFDGPNDSTLFTDSSANNHTITRNGNTKISTEQSKWGTGAAYFDGSGDYLTLTYNSTYFDWWTVDHTLEAWVYCVDLSTMSYLDGPQHLPVLIGNAEINSGSNYWSFGPIGDGKIRFYYWSGSQKFVTTSQTVSANTWTHLAMVKTASGIQIYVQGVGLGSPVAISGTPISSNSTIFTIGQINNCSMNAYVNDLRITKGIARYTGNFTPPTSPF